MSRLIFVPQYPAALRYQEWWLTELPKQFDKHFDEVVILVGEDPNERVKATRGDFSPLEEAIRWEIRQMDAYMNLELMPDDILFLADLSFPGLFANTLIHKRPSKVFMFCHATSLNHFDYFQHVRVHKWPMEACHASMCDKIFLGSKYHQRKLSWRNTVVTYLPYPPFPPSTNKEKRIDVFSASRITDQKVTRELEKAVEEAFDLHIYRYEAKLWDEYFDIMSKAKVLLITSKEETFGYQVVDAILNGCIPIAPKKFSYPELLDDDYLYTDKDDLIEKVRLALGGSLEVPEPKCDKSMKLFYDNIIKEMKE